MFKKILIAALMVASFSFAQINFGVHAAANMSTLWGDDAENAETGIGFSAGLGMKISLPLLPITVAPEVLIDMRNMTDDNDATLTEWALEVPVLVRLSLLPILYVEAGPTFALNLSVSGEDDDGNEVEFNDDYFNTFEFGLAFGVGTGIVPFVDIDFRVNLGLTNMVADIENPLGKDVEVNAKNLQFALGATYWF
ncbi:porin family protein [Fibrobacter sp. UWEL]|uniref:porin family protein n=1 Tax=Fibrobacter sp. UWEL TaxID=1896209 RepID=UPI00091786E1|nr:porin family protein [Fibrobacter sp. UWEL]SHL25905.1 Outer membrane protein beta-barrel domain-containing protein [Fibrobacter sp. UWEL]